jgi:hypothetical protein
MFWTKVEVSAAALVAATAAVHVSMAADQHPAKAATLTQVGAQSAATAPAPTAKTQAAAAKVVGPAKVNVKVGGETVALSVMKDGNDYFVVCPPCAGRTSCEKLDQDKAASKTTFKKNDTGYYACCSFCLNELKKDTAKYAKLFDAGLKAPAKRTQ